MKKLTLIISALALVMGLSQCTKPNVPTYSGSIGEKQQITFSINGGTGAKGAFVPSGADLLYKWDATDLLYVYGVNSEGSGTGFAGTLSTRAEDITDDYSAKFTGVVTIPENSTKLRFVHYGNDVNVTALGVATVDYSAQNGTLLSLSSKVIATSDKTIEPSGTYTSNDLTVRFAAAKFDLSYWGACDLTMAGVPQNALSVSENGDITCVEAASENTTLSGISSASDGYYVVFATSSTTETTEFNLNFSGNNYYGSKDVNVQSGTFYNDEAKGIVIVPEYADLGLTSGIKWASCNVLADRPEVEGGHYQWASLVDYQDSYSNWPDYYWGNGEVFSSDNKDIFKKYHGGKAEYVAPGYNMDNYDVIQDDDDIAKQNMKNGWEIPAMGDFKELVDNCYFYYTANYHNSGKNGYIVYVVKDDSDKGLWTDGNGNHKKNNGSVYVAAAAPVGEYTVDDTHIFIPLAHGVTEAGSSPMRGVYWSIDMAEKTSNLYPESARCLWITEDRLVPDHYSYRYAAYTIRAINKGL